MTRDKRTFEAGAPRLGLGTRTARLGAFAFPFPLCLNHAGLESRLFLVRDKGGGFFVCWVPLHAGDSCINGVAELRIVLHG